MYTSTVLARINMLRARMRSDKRPLRVFPFRETQHEHCLYTTSVRSLSRFFVFFRRGCTLKQRCAFLSSRRRAFRIARDSCANTSREYVRNMFCVCVCNLHVLKYTACVIRFLERIAASTAAQKVPGVIYNFSNIEIPYRKIRK